MRPRHLLLISSALFALLAGGIGTYSAFTAVSARSALARAQEEQSRRLAELRQSTDASRAQEKALTALRSAVSAEKDRLKASAQPPRTLSDRAIRVFATHPKLRDLQFALFRENLPKRFGAVYQELKLSPDQIAQFEDMATAHEFDRENMYAAAIEQGVDVNSDTFKSMHEQSIQDYYAAVGAQISPQLAQTVSQMDDARTRSLAMNAIVNDANTLISGDAAPMSAAQRAETTSILAQASAVYQEGGNATFDSLNLPAALQKISTILSPEQFEALQTRLGLEQMSVDVKTYFAGKPVNSRGK